MTSRLAPLAPRRVRSAGAAVPIAALVAVLIAALLRPATAAAQEGIQPGDIPAPAVVETLDGEAVDLAQWIGRKPVLVEFWATWCAVCRALEPKITAAHQRYGDRVEFLVVAVAVAQTTDAVTRHLQRHPQPGRVLWDASGEAVRAFDAPGTGVVFILDAEGTVAYTGAGADQDLERALSAVLGGATK